MIYLDTSVALAHLFAEDKCPPAKLWSETIVSSRLMEYELWVRVNARGLNQTCGESVRALLAKVAFLELSPAILARALEPFPISLRTLDAMHLASLLFLRAHGQVVELASYDERMAAAAAALDIQLYPA
jgi:predicted nucleic acid-binding protein